MIDFKNIRNNIVDRLEKYIRKLNLSDTLVYNILRGLHFGISIITGLILLFGSKFWFLCILIINIVVFSFFFLFHGCIITKLEQRFTTDDFTVIDPFLNFINVELTNENRYKYSIISNMFTCVITFFIYYIRFGKNKDEGKKNIEIIE